VSFHVAVAPALQKDGLANRPPRAIANHLSFLFGGVFFGMQSGHAFPLRANQEVVLLSPAHHTAEVTWEFFLEVSEVLTASNFCWLAC
jgi:hypothetical protein